MVASYTSRRIAFFNSRSNHTVYPHSVNMYIHKKDNWNALLLVNIMVIFFLRMLQVKWLRTDFILERNLFTVEDIFWIRFLLQLFFFFVMVFLNFVFLFIIVFKLYTKVEKIISFYVLIIQFWQLSTFCTPLPNNTRVFQNKFQIS